MKNIRIGICVLLTFAVAAHGAVEPWSETVLEVGAALLLVWWAFLWASDPAKKIHWNWLLAPVIGFWAIALVQYGARLTLAPFPTKIEILKLSALLILMFLAIQAYRTIEHWHSFVWFLLALGFAVSLFGIIQYFTFNGKLYWVRALTRPNAAYPFGPYVDRDHFAGLVELIIPSGLALLLTQAEETDFTPLVALFTLVPIGALVLTTSRGGIVSLVAEVAALLVLVFVKGGSRRRLVAAALVLALVAAFMAWIGVGRVIARYGGIHALQFSEARRIEMVRDTWRIFLDHPLLGSGLGTIEQVFPKYETVYDGYVVNHAHNDYVEALAETGILGGLCGGVFVFILFGSAWRGLQHSQNAMTTALRSGALAACCGMLVHSLVDFNLHIPSNGLLFLLQASFAARTRAVRRPDAGVPALENAQPQDSAMAQPLSLQ